jgi:hypothetical protein
MLALRNFVSDDHIGLAFQCLLVGRFEAIASHPKNNVAKMPAETLC